MRKLFLFSLLTLTLLLTSSCSPEPTVTLPENTNPPNPTPTVTLPEDTYTPIPNPTPLLPKVTWTNIGPGGGGNLTSIAFASSSTIYVGCNVGGVYRTTDYGQTWTIHNQGLKAYSVKEIVVDLRNPSVIYVGTYDGVYKSVDGGDHWEWKNDGFPDIHEWPWGVPIGAIAVDPNDSSTVYAGVGDTDLDRWGRGRSTKALMPVKAGLWSIEALPLLTQRQSFMISSFIQKIPKRFISPQIAEFFKSDDGGVSWERKEQGLPHRSIREIALYPGDPDILYITLFSPPNQTPWQGGVYKSTDSGETWVKKTRGLDVKIGSPGDRPYATANYEQIEVDPTNPDIVFLGANYWTGKDGIYKTTNGGDSWQLVVRDDNWDFGWSIQGGTQRVESMAMDPLTLLGFFGVKLAFMNQ